MFIFWLLLFIALAVGEEVKLSWDAKHNKIDKSKYRCSYTPEELKWLEEQGLLRNKKK